MREITWMENRQGRASSDTEVRVYVEKGEKYTRFTFYGTSSAKVTRKEYMRVGVSANRVYFDESEERGFKLSGSGKNKYIRLPGKKSEFAGDYKLNFDAEMKLWYIERSWKK